MYTSGLGLHHGNSDTFSLLELPYRMVMLYCQMLRGVTKSQVATISTSSLSIVTLFSPLSLSRSVSVMYTA